MMREILFRGKRADNGEWVVSSDVFLGGKKKYFYIPNPDTDMSAKAYLCREVIPETVGQFTGLILNGTKVFEDDIVKREYTLYHSEKKRTRETQIGVVWYSNRHCNFEIKGKCQLGKPFKGDTLEVIGNIHDNPELLGGADNG